MLRGGSDAPMIIASIFAVGSVSSAEQNKVHSSKFTQFIMEKTGLPIERYYKPILK